MSLERFMIHAQKLQDGDWRIQITMRDHLDQTTEHSLSPMLCMFHKGDDPSFSNDMVRVLEFVTRQIRW